MPDVTLPASSPTAALRARFDELSVAHKRVAAFILEEPRKAAFLSASRIAAELGLSTATVVRLAPAGGIAGTPVLVGA